MVLLILRLMVLMMLLLLLLRMMCIMTVMMVLQVLMIQLILITDGDGTDTVNCNVAENSEDTTAVSCHTRVAIRMMQCEWQVEQCHIRRNVSMSRHVCTCVGMVTNGREIIRQRLSRRAILP